jgi:hypothetical protein
MLFSDIILFSENETKHIEVLSEQKAEELFVC